MPIFWFKRNAEDHAKLQDSWLKGVLPLIHYCHVSSALTIELSSGTRKRKLSDTGQTTDVKRLRTLHDGTMASGAAQPLAVLTIRTFARRAQRGMEGNDDRNPSTYVSRLFCLIILNGSPESYLFTASDSQHRGSERRTKQLQICAVRSAWSST